MTIQDVFSLELPLTRRLRLMQRWLAQRWNVEVRGRICYWLYEYVNQYHSEHETLDCLLKIKLIERDFFEGLQKEPIPTAIQNLAIIRQRDAEVEKLFEEGRAEIARSKIFQTFLKIRPIDRTALNVAMPDHR